MSKYNEQVKKMMRSPKDLMDFQMTGRLPNAVQPSSPLITFLESLTPRDRLQMVGVRLSPKLGYQSGAQFGNAEQMLRYLKPRPWVAGSWPAESCRIKSFRATITKSDFEAAQKKYGTKKNECT